MRRGWLWLLLVGCGESAGAPPDATPDAFSVCFGTVPGSRVCFAQAPVFGPLTLPAAVDTNPANAACAPDVLEPSACVLVGESITIDSRITVTGRRPLLLLGRDSITITSAGAIDVSTTMERVGAGARTCSVAGAGSGGTLGGIGGAGGGPAAPRESSALLRGGCAGTQGYTHSDAVPGRGGGAVALIAPSVTLDGVINASGAPGGGIQYYCTHGCGGGGGGSGGMIVVDTGMLFGTGVLLANGGGGGSGETIFNGTSPDGAAPNEATPLVPAAGGDYDNDGQGVTGGAGSAGPKLNGAAGVLGYPHGTQHAGGGGGGGGIIRIPAPAVFAGTSSPPRT